ncbi:MAG: HRDC domain-containing protein, partial [Burkholderiaceae bacterium]
GVPAYVVFHDGTLHAIAQSRPREVDELRGISGVGEKKLERYGASLVELIRSESA